MTYVYQHGIIGFLKQKFWLPKNKLHRSLFVIRDYFVSNGTATKGQHLIMNGEEAQKSEPIKDNFQMSVPSGEMALDSVAKCKQMVNNFLALDPGYWSNEIIGSDPHCIKQCFQILRDCVLEARRRGEHEEKKKLEQSESKVSRLMKIIEEKDSEIYLLIKLLQQEKQKETLNIQRDQKYCVLGENPSVAGRPAKFKAKEWTTSIDLQKGSTGEELIAFQAFIDTGGPGETLYKEMEEIKFMIKCKQRQEEETAKMLQAVQEKIDELRQQLDEAPNELRLGELEKYWLFSTFAGENRELAPPNHFRNPKDFQMKIELRAYKTMVIQLQQLHCEKEHMCSNLRKVEIQLEAQFRCYWERFYAMQCQEDSELSPTGLSSSQLSNAECISIHPTSPHSSCRSQLQTKHTHRHLLQAPSRSMLEDNIEGHVYFDKKSRELHISSFHHSLQQVKSPLQTPTTQSPLNWSPQKSTFGDPQARSKKTGLSTFKDNPLYEQPKNSLENKTQPMANEQTKDNSFPLSSLPDIDFDAMKRPFYFLPHNKNTLVEKQKMELHQESKEIHSQETECKKKSQYGPLSTLAVPSSGIRENDYCSSSSIKCLGSDEQTDMGLSFAHSSVMTQSIEADDERAKMRLQLIAKEVNCFHLPTSRKTKESEAQLESCGLVKVNGVNRLICSEITKNNEKEEIDHLKSKLPLTGEEDVDDEIIAFYMARKKILEGKNNERSYP